MPVITRYLSIAALVDAAEAFRNYREFSDSDCGNEAPSVTVRKARHGDASLVPEAEKLIDKLSMSIELPERSWQADVTGAFPIVPEGLAGNPDCMRRRVTVESESSPVNIFVVVTSSHAVSAETMLKRGTAVLALTLALSRIPPIALHVVSIGDSSLPSSSNESIICATVNTTPLDIATAAYVLTSAAFFRRLAYGLASSLHCTRGRWPSGYRQNRQAYLAGLVAALSGNPQTDLIVDAAYLHDSLLTNPLAFIQAQIDRFTQSEEGV